MHFPALTLCLLLAIGSNAFLVSDIQAMYDKLYPAFQNVTGLVDKMTSQGTVDTLKPTGESLGTRLLISLKTTGSQLLSQGLSSLMFGALNVLHGTPTPVKRNLFRELSQVLQNVQSGADNILTNKVDGLQRLLTGALGKLQELANLIPHLGGEQLEHFGQAVNQVVAHHSAGADSFLQQLVDGLKAQVASSLYRNGNKRTLPVGLDYLIDSLIKSFTPKIEQLKQVVSRFGELLKQSAQHLAVHIVVQSSSIEDKLNGVLAIRGTIGTF
ncbi:hypothetical protein ACJMK2_001753 [Sinanodonta woodiana]|uniref:Uncharacterized protein n=1 Tax=Sinanodonta woodiana TaxID=1069815 RepID=A0ABD3XT62_SINWO